MFESRDRRLSQEEASNWQILTFVAVAFAEFVDLAGSIDDLLFTGKERVTFRAYIYTHSIIAIGRLGYEGISTTAAYVNLLVLWVNAGFHCLIIYPVGFSIVGFSVELADHTEPSGATQVQPWYTSSGPIRRTSRSTYLRHSFIRFLMIEP